MNINLKFASYLYKVRTQRDLTQEQMAEILDISSRWYQCLEKGTNSPNFKVVCLFVKNFNFDLHLITEGIPTSQLSKSLSK